MLWSIETMSSVTITKFFFKMTADQVLVSIGSQVHVRLTCCKQGWVVQKPVEANPG